MALRLHSLGTRLAGEGRKSKRLLRLALPLDDPVRRRLFWGGEAVFAVVYALGALLASFAPDVWNTEKPMDMGFINAINQSGSFPPHDPWMSGESLNYYYFGHVVLAWPIKLLGLAPDTGYLLELGPADGADGDRPSTRSRGRCGRRVARRSAPARRAAARSRRALVAAALVTILGNLAGVQGVDQGRRPAQGLRLVRPVAGDPGHDQRVPVVLVPARRPARARARAAVHGARARRSRCRSRCAARAGTSSGARCSRRWRSGSSLGALYAINSWSYPVAAGILAASVITWVRSDAAHRKGYPLVWLGLVILASFILILPFILNFDPEARGIGFVHVRRPFGKWLGDMTLIYGILAWPLVAAFAARCSTRRNRWRWIGGGLAASVVVGSLLAGDNLDRRDGRRDLDGGRRSARRCSAS